MKQLKKDIKNGIGKDEAFTKFISRNGDPKKGSRVLALFPEQLFAEKYAKANKILITADAGGSNGSRTRLWKWELQRLSNEFKIPISVCHFPPGTSKWNKVEHRLFSFISSNWRGTPLNDYETVVNLISATTTTKGLKVSCRLDKKKYPTGVKISDEEWEQIHIKRDKFHGDWNYTILPN